jgi:CheY-like chemotaxis protein
MLEKPTLLLVENDYITAFIALSYFEKYFSCTHVKGATEALITIENHTFDLVLLDINLGDSNFDGVSVMKVMREKPELTGIRICAFTSYSLPDAEEQFLKLGFDEYIEKTTEYEEVANRLVNSLKNLNNDSASS